MDDQNQDQEPGRTPSVIGYQSTEGPSSPQAGMPNQQYTPPVPQTQLPSDPFAPDQPYQTPVVQPGRSSKKLLMKLAVIVLVVVAISAAIFAFVLQKPSPDEVFNQAIQHALQTKQFTQKVAVQGGSSVTLLYDVSDVKNSKVSLVGDISLGGAKLSFESYGDGKNEFLKIKSFNFSGPDADKYLNKWTQLRKDGAWAGDDASSLANFLGANSRFLVLGDYIFGNFSAAEQTELLKLMSGKKVNDYKTEKVTKDKFDGHDVYVYEVTSNQNALKEANKKAAKFMGIPDEDLQIALSYIGSESTMAKMFVRIDTGQLVKVETEQSEMKVTNVYSAYNTTKLPAQPKPQISYEDFSKYWSNF